MIKLITVNQAGVVTITGNNGGKFTITVDEAKKHEFVEIRRAIARLWPVRFGS